MSLIKYISTVKLREFLSEFINQVHYGEHPIIITRRNKAVAKLVPLNEEEKQQPIIKDE